MNDFSEVESTSETQKRRKATQASGETFMTAYLESTRQSMMQPVTPTWKLSVTDRRLMWLQKQHPGLGGYNLQIWASGSFKEP